MALLPVTTPPARKREEAVMMENGRQKALRK